MSRIVSCAARLRLFARIDDAAMDSKTQHLLTAPPLGLLIGLATPNSIAFFIQSFVSMAEVWVIGTLGTAPLAAIALAFPLLMLMQTLPGGALGGAVASSIARALGAGKPERAERLIWHALALAAAGAGLILLTFTLGGYAFLRFLGGSELILDYAYRYGFILSLGGLGLWLVGVVTAIYRGMGDMRFPASMMIVNAVIQVPLSICLVTGAFGLPALGVAGAAVSAVVVAALVSTLMLLRLIYGNTLISLRRHPAVFSRELFADILRVFAPASLSPLLTVATIVSLTAIVGSFGEKALAGYGIGSRIEFLMIPLIFGLGAAMTSLVGMAIGAGDQARAERIGWIGSCCASVLAGSIGLLLAFTANAWIPVFTQDPEIHAAALAYMRIVAPCFAFMGLGFSLYFASQGAGAMLWPVTATATRILVAVGGALVFTRVIGMGLEGVFYAAAIAMVFYGVVIAAALKLGAWRRTGSSAAPE